MGKLFLGFSSASFIFLIMNFILDHFNEFDPKVELVERVSGFKSPIHGNGKKKLAPGYVGKN